MFPRLVLFRVDTHIGGPTVWLTSSIVVNVMVGEVVVVVVVRLVVVVGAVAVSVVVVV